ncbi:MAG: hypothetical protein IGR76_04390 [Synechococcales cyanobacterium T60_A2020_003]|nr:hypothetical protein [Synechococcales cyanobacterium T60_A2020_003]
MKSQHSDGSAAENRGAIARGWDSPFRIEAIPKIVGRSREAGTLPLG